MFYKELLEIQSVDAAVVENFDFWLATLPKKSQKVSQKVSKKWLLKCTKMVTALRKSLKQQKFL